jgi:hypothetical protein
MLYVPDTVLGYRYYPDTTFIISNVAFTNSCTTNSFGFPGDEFSLKKKEGVFRILIVGSSDDTGFVSDGSYSYTRRLNKMFDDHHYPVEIINCSIDGSGRIVRNIEMIKNECINYDPDLILLRNELPLKDVMRYRMTYKGCIISMPVLSNIELIKEYIDNMLEQYKHWFRAYYLSYIFRYYLKIYFDTRKLNSNHKFVKFSDDIFGSENLASLSMYVRKEVRSIPHMPFDIDIYEKNEPVHTTNLDVSHLHRIASFSSGQQAQMWIDVDIANYFNAKHKKDTLELLLNTKLSKGRSIAFALDDIDSNKFAPRLHISGNTGDTTVFPFDAGTIGFDNLMRKDTVMWICNSKDSTKSKIAFLKFDMPESQSLDACKLKLYVKQVSLGEYIPNDQTYTLAESADSLKSLQTFLGDRGIQFSLFETYTSPVKYDASFARRQINYVNLDIPFKKEYSFGVLDGHSTQAGHQAIAEAFFKALLDIIPEQFIQPHENN